MHRPKQRAFKIQGFALTIVFSLWVLGHGLDHEIDRNGVHFHTTHGWLGPPYTIFVDDSGVIHFYFAKARAADEPVVWGHATTQNGTSWIEHDTFLAPRVTNNSSAWGGSIVELDRFRMRFLVLWSRVTCHEEDCVTSVRTQWTNDGFSARSPSDASMLFALPNHKWASAFRIGSDIYFVSVPTSPSETDYCRLEFFSLVNLNSALVAIPAGSLSFEDVHLVCENPAILVFDGGGTVLALTWQHPSGVATTYYIRINIEQLSAFDPIPYQRLNVFVVDAEWRVFEHSFYASHFAFVEIERQWLAVGWLRQDLVLQKLRYPGSVNEMTTFRDLSFDESQGAIRQRFSTQLRRYQCVFEADWRNHVLEEPAVLRMAVPITTETPFGTLSGLTSADESEVINPQLHCGFEVLVPAAPSVIEIVDSIITDNGHNDLIDDMLGGLVDDLPPAELKYNGIRVPGTKELGASWTHTSQDTRTLLFRFVIFGTLPLQAFDPRVVFANPAGDSVALTFDGSDFAFTDTRASPEEEEIRKSNQKMHGKAGAMPGVWDKHSTLDFALNRSSDDLKGSMTSMDVEILLSSTSIELLGLDGLYSLTHVYCFDQPIDRVFLSAKSELYLREFAISLFGADWSGLSDRATVHTTLTFLVLAIMTVAFL